MLWVRFCRICNRLNRAGKPCFSCSFVKTDLLKNRDSYDFIIAGGGCAGLSLAWQMALEPGLAAARILVIEREAKTTNDRTWCFWEQAAGPFEHIVAHRWENVWFKAAHFSKCLHLAPYTYKMIHADRFYQTVRMALAQKPQFTWLQAEVQQIQPMKSGAGVHTTAGVYTARQVFSSLPPPQTDQSGHYGLLQHFKGWFVQSTEPVFDARAATLMDFTIPQAGDTRFMYVLPFSPFEALVEFTVFSANLLEANAYDEALAHYLTTELQLKNHRITHSEFGVIPMCSAPPAPSGSPFVVPIGIAGGMAKASTGYTFTRIQRQVEQVAKQLAHRGFYEKPTIGWKQRFAFYDKVLLHVLIKKKVAGKQIFSRLFRYNSPAAVFRFLDEDTHFGQEYRLINTMPIFRFMGAAGWEMWLWLRRLLKG